MSNVSTTTIAARVLTYQVTAPGSAGTAATIYSLLTANQKAELASFTSIRVYLNNVTNAINLFSAVPSTGALSADSNAFPLAANTLSYEVKCVDVINRLFVKSNVVGTTAVNCVIEVVPSSSV